MMMMISTVIVSLLLMFGVNADRDDHDGRKHDDQKGLELKDGPCTSPQPISGFDPQTYAQNDWYVEYAQQNPLDDDHKCIVHDIKYKSKSKSMTITVRYKDPSDSSTHEEEYKAVPVDNKQATYNLTAKNKGNKDSSDYWIHVKVGKIDSNRKTTAYLQFACQNTRRNKHYEYYQILSTKNPISDSDYQTLKKIARNNGNREKFVKIDQDNC